MIDKVSQEDQFRIFLAVLKQVKPRTVDLTYIGELLGYSRPTIKKYYYRKLCQFLDAVKKTNFELECPLNIELAEAMRQDKMDF